MEEAFEFKCPYCKQLYKMEKKTKELFIKMIEENEKGEKKRRCENCKGIVYFSLQDNKLIVQGTKQEFERLTRIS